MPVLFIILSGLAIILVLNSDLFAGTVNEMRTKKPSIPEKVAKMAQCIAKAEGFYVSGSVPQRARNPGDLKLPASMSPNGYLAGHTIFNTDAEGWAALYRQIELMRNGTSKVYNLDMTFEQVARLYAENWQPWLNNVVSCIGVTQETTLREFFEG